MIFETLKTIFILLLTIFVFVIIIFLINQFLISPRIIQKNVKLIERPGYLDVPLPDFSKVEKIFIDPKFQEIIHPLPTPEKILEKGRSNPFLP